MYLDFESLYPQMMTPTLPYIPQTVSGWSVDFESEWSPIFKLYSMGLDNKSFSKIMGKSIEAKKKYLFVEIRDTGENIEKMSELNDILIVAEGGRESYTAIQTNLTYADQIRQRFNYETWLPLEMVPSTKYCTTDGEYISLDGFEFKKEVMQDIMLRTHLNLNPSCMMSKKFIFCAAKDKAENFRNNTDAVSKTLSIPVMSYEDFVKTLNNKRED